MNLLKLKLKLHLCMEEKKDKLYSGAN
jgi:hypothetical protein